MLVLLLTLGLLIGEVVLITLVAVRAWDYRPARLFIWLSLSIIGVVMGTLLRDSATNEQVIYVVQVLIVFCTLLYSFLILWVITALFMPEWWEGSRPIRWISMPYIIVSLVLMADMMGGFGLFVNGVREVNGIYRFTTVMPGAAIMQGLASIGTLLYILVLGVAFVRNPKVRLVTGLLIAGVITSLILTATAPMVGAFARITTILQVLPITIVLAYSVLGTKLFVPTRAALDLALQAMSEAVAVLDQEGKLLYVNPRAADLGLTLDTPLSSALATTGADQGAIKRLTEAVKSPNPNTIQTLTIGNRLISVTLTPVEDMQKNTRGLLLLGRDITEIEQRTVLLEQERIHLATMVEQLEAEQQERARLMATVQALSLPIIPVLDGVLVLPLIGTFDSHRANEFTLVLLHGIEREKARIVLLDITGIHLLDQTGAAGLLRGVTAAGLLGARCILVGVRPEIAQSLVALGVALDGLATAATLQQALLSVIRSTANNNGHSPWGRKAVGSLSTVHAPHSVLDVQG